MLKSLISLDPLIYRRNNKLRFCMTCDGVATMGATFDVGYSVEVIEKYCDTCSKEISRSV